MIYSSLERQRRAGRLRGLSHSPRRRAWYAIARRFSGRAWEGATYPIMW
ncbi:MAG TPA: hypothetical protein VNL77_21935 [Roseiflexaceae bacterium]|nr:hypothetical protein [Roseiflexaceae bacterium]